MSHLEKYIIDEQNGFEYELIGDYYYPTGRRIVDGVLTPAEIPENDEPDTECYVGIWGQRHLRFIRQNRPFLYFDLVVSGKLNDYLADINKRAEELFLRLSKEMATREGVSEQLKAENQMAWVQKMNQIAAGAKEIVNHDLIFA